MVTIELKFFHLKMWQKENLSNFVKDVQSIYPNATGMPVVQF